ncbi:nucleotidyltransferase family protein [uncultured Clostridium sp.]|uniref:nucleotidyltransferase family protein n=1 Tax=uncultured Clostridium sp. TaxID=59620 RepID=UPI0028EC226C|nr:nucleotidyltransferase family protein [uncultured Clostridium sp.]
MKINGLILAAGMSRRMGEFKPLLKINNKTMIEHSIDSMIKAGVKDIVLVLGHRGSEIEEVLKLYGYPNNMHVVYNNYYDTTEMLDSIKIGLNKIGDCDAFFLLPGDMPAIDPHTFLKLIKVMEGYETKSKIVFPTVEGHRKHPPLVSKTYIPDILRFESDGGLRELWKSFELDILSIPVDDMGCTIDVDTKVQYKKVCNYMKL